MKLIGYCCEDEHRVLVYEYMARGSVENNLFSSEFFQSLLVYRLKFHIVESKKKEFEERIPCILH